MAALLLRFALSRPGQWLAPKCLAGCLVCTRACGRLGGGCAAVCGACAGCCTTICDSLTRCSAACGRGLDTVFAKPFSGLVFVAVLASVVPFAVLLYYLVANWGAAGCDKPLDTWLIVCLVIFFIHFIFAFYLSHRLSNTSFADLERNPAYDVEAHDEENMRQYATHFFLYDWVVSLYILVGFFSVAWGIVGLVWSGDAPSECTDRSGDLVHAVIAGGIILLSFAAVFTLGTLCSIYSGYITVCVRDLSCLKCCCWCVYYPCCYDHATAREKHFGHQARLIDPNQQARQQRAQGAAQQQHDIVPALAPQQPQQGADSGMGGRVYLRPGQAAAEAAAAQPIYSHPPRNYQAEDAADSSTTMHATTQNYAAKSQSYQAQEALLAPGDYAHPVASAPPDVVAPPVYASAPLAPANLETPTHAHTQVEGLPHVPGGIGPGAGASVPPSARIPVAQPVKR